MASLATLDPEAPGGQLASRRWRDNFERHAGRHSRLRMEARPELAPDLEAGLRSSLAVFQLGETGEGTHLLVAAASTGDEAYVEAIAAFLAEEHEHARLLAMILAEFDEPLLTHHWTDGVFVALRRVSGLRAEVLTLLVAELVALRYYEVLHHGLAGHRDLAAIFGAIHADEVRHVDFHADTLPRHLERWSPGMWWCARVVWNLVLYGSAFVVAVGHRRLLRACGVGIWRFVLDCHRNFRQHESRFFRPRSRVGRSISRD